MPGSIPAMTKPAHIHAPGTADRFSRYGERYRQMAQSRRAAAKARARIVKTALSAAIAAPEVIDAALQLLALFP